MNDTDAYYMEQAEQHANLHPVEAEYSMIKARPIGNIVPYIEQEEETADLSPATKRKIKVFQAIFPVASVSIGAMIGIVHVAMTGALNTVFGWCIGGGFGLAVLSGLFGGGSKVPAQAQGSGKRITVEQSQKTTIE